MAEVQTKKADKKSEKKQSWFEGLKSEFGKIIWPDKNRLTKETVAVVAISIFLGAIITLLDTIIKFGIDFLVQL